MYKNEKELFDQYMLKYKVPEKVYKECPDENQIFSAGMVIYTFSGTVVAESLLKGYKTVFCGDRFPATFGLHCDSREELIKYIELETSNIDNRVELADKGLIDSAKILMNFWYGPKYKNITSLAPIRPCLPVDTSFQRLKLMFNQFRKMLFTRNYGLDAIDI
jgi:hypothetical protein